MYNLAKSYVKGGQPIQPGPLEKHVLFTHFSNLDSFVICGSSTAIVMYL